MNPVRLRFIVDACRDFLGADQSSTQQQLSVLDVGCGGGILSESLTRFFPGGVVGIDPSAALVTAAKERAAQFGDRVQYLKSTLANYVPQKRPSVVCLLEVLEHVEDSETLLQQARNVVANDDDDALLILSSLNATPESFAASIVGAEYIMGYLPIGTHDGGRLYRSPETVRQAAAAAGWEQVRVQGMVPTNVPIVPDWAKVPAACVLGNWGSQWQWKLSDANTRVNWIAAYRKI